MINEKRVSVHFFSGTSLNFKNTVVFLNVSKKHSLYNLKRHTEIFQFTKNECTFHPLALKHIILERFNTSFSIDEVRKVKRLSNKTAGCRIQSSKLLVFCSCVVILFYRNQCWKKVTFIASDSSGEELSNSMTASLSWVLVPQSIYC